MFPGRAKRSLFVEHRGTGFAGPLVLPPRRGEAKRSLGVEFVDCRQAATNSFHFLTMYSFSSITAFQQAMPPMRCS